MSGLLHIASVVVQHRPEASGALDALLAERDDVELALREGGRSILLCESGSESGLMQIIDALHALPGIHAVNLVHHHAEDADSLNQEIHP